MPVKRTYDIELKGVSKTIDGEKILEGIDWKVKMGEHWAMIGANGAGKTTLMKIITGYMWPTDGQVSVLGHRFGEVDLRELRKQVGYVNSALLQEIPSSDSVLKVVLSGKFGSLGLYDEVSEQDRRHALEMLDVMGCSALSGKRFGNLSQGEMQKVLIARALMPEPGLLILDEPAIGLDPSSREGFLERLGQIGEMDDGPTMVYITHHIEEITTVFERVIALKGGMVLEAGEKSEVLTEEVLRQTFEMGKDVIEKDGRYVFA